MPRLSGNPLLPGGIERYGRAVQYKRTNKWKRAKTSVKPKKVKKPTVKTVPVGGEKNGETRKVPISRSPRYVFADKPKRPIGYKVKRSPRPAKIRDSITPGTVLILVAGPYRGHRAIFLKALKSGLLLVTGPFLINGVPLRRVNQAFVIATSTKIDVSGLTMLDNVDDDFFKASSANEKLDFFSDKKTRDGRRKKKLPEERVKMQKDVDAPLIAKIKETPYMKKYLASKFTLTKGVHPHALKF